MTTYMQMRDRLHQASQRIGWALEQLGQHDDDAAMHLAQAGDDLSQVLDVLETHPLRKI